MSARDDRYFQQEELQAMGFRALGHGVQIARTARLYEPAYLEIGDFSCIDDFCVVSGAIHIGAHVHLAHGCRVVGGREGIRFEDFSGLAFGVTVFAQSDDYTGLHLTNPTVPMKYRKIQRGAVKLERHVIVGTHSVIFPGVVLAEGSSVGACSMLLKSTEPWGIYVGVPARKVRERARDLLTLEQALRNEQRLEA